MAWSTTGPTLRKEQQTTTWGYISGSDDRLGFAGPRATTTSNTTPQNSLSGKAGLCTAHTFGIQQQQGCTHQIGLSRGGGGGCIATPLHDHSESIRSKQQESNKK